MWRFNDVSSDVRRNGNQMRPLPERTLACHQEGICLGQVVKRGLGIARRPRDPLKVIQDLVTNTFKRMF